jgi:hypothetical protein
VCVQFACDRTYLFPDSVVELVIERLWSCMHGYCESVNAAFRLGENHVSYDG